MCVCVYPSLARKNEEKYNLLSYEEIALKLM